ncbi:RHS repeat protein [Nitriliruptoria bacterium AS10]|nr:RHS repeat protein [Salsipaludibacter albus]
MVDETGQTTWDYQPHTGRLTTVTSPAGTVGYGYDDAGRRTSMTTPDGPVTHATTWPVGAQTGQRWPARVRRRIARPSRAGLAARPHLPARPRPLHRRLPRPPRRPRRRRPQPLHLSHQQPNDPHRPHRHDHSG